MAYDDLSAKKPKIVVLDDQGSALTLSKAILEKKGVSVATIQVDGSQSLDQLTAKILEQNPDLVLTDLEMGAVTGLDVRDALQRAKPELAVVIHSTTPDKVPNHSAIAASNAFGRLKTAYSKQDAQRFTDITAYLNPSVPERAI